MSYLLTIVAGTGDSIETDRITRDLQRTINRQTDIRAALPAVEAEAGSKGDPVTVGTLTLAFLTGGAAVALANVFKAFFERNKHLKFEIKKADGSFFSFDSQNMSKSEVAVTMDRLSRFLEEQSLDERWPEEK